MIRSQVSLTSPRMVALRAKSTPLPPASPSSASQIKENVKWKKAPHGAFFVGKWNKMNSLLKQLSQDAENAGSANMSLEEINLEIDAARKEAEITKLNQKKSE